LILTGTLDVRVRGSWLFPHSIFSRLTILCAILRQLHLILQITLSGELQSLNPNILFVDQLSAGLPILVWRVPQAPVFFYCHFPDQLLVRGRSSVMKRLYRIPFDAWEGWSMGFADAVAVNSEFTKGIVEGMWKGLGAKTGGLRVVYPCVDTVPKESDLMLKISEGKGEDGVAFAGEKVVLSINRFERKKDVGLAIRAFAALPEAKRKGVRLVIAGMLPQPLKLRY
jgi:alpha-1,3/alpha-1,6-mannosyltransferase